MGRRSVTGAELNTMDREGSRLAGDQERLNQPARTGIDEEDTRRLGSSSPTRWWVLLPVAAVVVGLVGFFGWYQFGKNAERPISMVHDMKPEGSGLTVGEMINDFLKEEGVVISEAFKPRWGAEEKGDEAGERYIVSYTYEDGRDAMSVSWEVDLGTDEIKPRGEWAEELISPDR